MNPISIPSNGFDETNLIPLETFNNDIVIPIDEIQKMLDVPVLDTSDTDISMKASLITKKEKPPKEAKYLAKIGPLEIHPFWRGDDDDEDDDDEVRRSLSTKNHATAAFALFSISATSAFFYREPVISVGLASGSIIISRTWYTYLENPNAKRVAFAVAVFALAIPFILQNVTPDQDKQDTLHQILMALPWSYPAFGMFKAEVKAFELHTKLIKLGERFGKTLSEKAAKILSTSIQIIPSLAIVAVNPSLAITSAAGVIAKTNIRTVTNDMGQYIHGMEVSTPKKIAAAAFGTVSTIAAGIGLGGNFMGWFNSGWGNVVDLALVLPGTDMASRTIKATIKAPQKKEKKAKKIAKKNGIVEAPLTGSQKAIDITKKTAELIFYAGAIVGLAYFIGQTGKTSQSASITAALLSDIVSFLKIATKKYSLRSVIIVSSTGIAGAAAAYGTKQWSESNHEIPGYVTLIVTASILNAFLIYHMKRAVRPEKE